MKNRNKAYFDKNGVQNEDKKLKKWEANFFDTINKYKDLDITTAHQSENSKLIESKTKIDDFNKNEDPIMFARLQIFVLAVTDN